ncbi:OmpA family protein [Yokenella regensburgei]|uniref:OmpA family protein n=1 Tax=Yokenella regensburgei TaxID=158877 RepID=UPI001432F442|nr:OmpA family protein [Yokenella regensburgei]QIU89841.1 OmpA family protein [Yokenella regensburgei]
MRYVTKPLLALLAMLLALWLIWGFWPLGTGSRASLSMVCVLLAGSWGWRFWLWLQNVQNGADDAALPPEQFEGSVVLVCGDTDGLFPDSQQFRETRQGWYIAIRQPEQLVRIAESIASARPALTVQVSVLLTIIPEQWQDADEFSGQLHQWQRAISQCRRFFNGLPPVWGSVWFNAPQTDADTGYHWYFLTSNREGIQVQEQSGVAQAYLTWCQDVNETLRFSRLSHCVWLQGLFRWLKPRVTEVLAVRHHDAMAVPFCMLGVCVGPVKSLEGNLWQQHVAATTTLSPSAKYDIQALPLPDDLLSHLPRRRGMSRLMHSWRIAGIFLGVFLLLAMLASWVNNQRLIQNVDDHLSLYQQLNGKPAEPKVVAQNQLRRDGRMLDNWQRDGAPMRYTLGLYQGMRLVVPVRTAINDWAPPPPPPPIIKKVVQGPKTVRLDSMSLFDSGEYSLKPGSTRMLVNSLVGIKAKPGWLIVVSGHTDNTGNPQLNQTLSQKRAEAVRNWMRDTGSVPESCFAVQGYGENRPIATNDTTEGRALNRRVEISLVPQANACPMPGNTNVSSQDDDATQNQME